MDMMTFLVIVSRGRRPREGALCCKMVQCVLLRARGVSWSRVGALASLEKRRNAVAKAVARPGTCSGAARARGQPQTLDFGYWTRWLHFAVVRVCVKLDCDALGQRNVKFVVFVFTLRQSNRRG